MFFFKVLYFYDAALTPFIDTFAPVGVTQTLSFVQFPLQFEGHVVLVIGALLLVQLHVPNVDALSGVVKNVIVSPPVTLISSMNLST